MIEWFKSILIFFNLIHKEPTFKFKGGVEMKISEMTTAHLQIARYELELPAITCDDFKKASFMLEALRQNKTYQLILYEIENHRIAYMEARGMYDEYSQRN